MRKLYQRFFRWLDRFDTIASMILLTIMIITIFLQILFRYIIEDALTWTEEMARYAMIFVVYLGVGMGTKSDSHMGVTVFVDLFKGRARTAVLVLTYCLTLMIYIVLMILSWQMVQRALAAPQYSPAMRVPIFLMYTALPIGFANAILRLVQKLIRIAWPEIDSDPDSQEAEQAENSQGGALI